MNRIEIVGLFTALKKFCEKDDLDSVKEIVDAVLDEAVKDKNKKGEDS